MPWVSTDMKIHPSSSIDDPASRLGNSVLSGFILPED